ncbi:PTS sugar transporter subunit IIA [Tepidimicrobium xylanilyticum]|uniref:PTS system, fructose-specific IIA component n=1 Tax=Tepidimicrobium xylanilyticum TaxID=1123352 RepID=A0A1H2WFF1_9FIRM|nr:PTS sugar transporter subunit IIA [Tepidimicrobium xylanilyticum]GMG95255.1 PTS system fructose-specific EIIA component [Tepidimicrobium xylanilyticum]SDW79261.1 PTS system, fructose-specific IIA component [Tepidimicrobium xylanilyticum]
MKLIICGHGAFAPGIFNAANMIFGNDEDIFAIPLLDGEGIDDFKNKIKDITKNIDENEEILFMTDIFGGTPYNVVSEYAYEHSNVDVITGTSLPIVIEALALKNSTKLKDLVFLLKNSNNENFKIYSEEFKKANSNISNDL